MQKISLSIKIYIGLIILLAILGAVNVFLLQGPFATMAQSKLPAAKPILAIVNAAIMLILYGSLGLLGLKLAQKLGFAEIWDPRVTNQKRFTTPALVGIALGVFFIC